MAVELMHNSFDIYMHVNLPIKYDQFIDKYLNIMILEKELPKHLHCMKHKLIHHISHFLNFFP